MNRGLLLCTDLDRTLIPNGDAPESPGARDLFARFVARDGLTLVYVSGRDAPLIKEAIREYDLPHPDYVVADVGTTIYETDEEGSWIDCVRWQKEIGRGWAGEAVELLSRSLAGLPTVKKQESSKQGRFKLSYYALADIREDDLLAEVRSRLASLAIPMTLVYSYDEPRRVGLLDVLPERADKLHALEFLIGEIGFDVSDTIFCGDSGNDLSVLTSSIPGVLVANASDEVKRRARELADLAGNSSRLYIAGRQLFGMNGNYSAGILEGVCHYHPDALAWLTAAGR